MVQEVQVESVGGSWFCGLIYMQSGQRWPRLSSDEERRRRENYRYIEAISSDDLMGMRSLGNSRIHQRVGALYDELGAPKSKKLPSGRSILREQRDNSDRLPKHDEF
jgi:hypothetical protein